MSRTPPNSEPGDAVYKDPFTGTTPVGPVQTRTNPSPRGRWSLAAGWFMLALLLLVLIFVGGWLLRR